MEHIILYAIVPIFVVMLAGFLSGKKGYSAADDAKKFNKVVLDYALPAPCSCRSSMRAVRCLWRDIKLSVISVVE